MTQDTDKDTSEIQNSEIQGEAKASTFASFNQSVAKTLEVSEATQTVIGKYINKTAKAVAISAQRDRVSRRLVMAKRAQYLTCVCTDTGIVSILEIPAIPGFAAEYFHPLSILSNARGLAGRGVEYLRKLDTQVLAGILLTLAGDYGLFRFKPFDSGAHKNAILRSAGKDILIDTIVIVENLVHSRNRQFLPSLSLIEDVDGQYLSLEGKLSNYVKLLAESIAKPDTSPYDENAKPAKVMRPVYIRDVEKAERKISYLARQELSRAKKEFDADKKEAKKLIADLLKAGKIDSKGRSSLLSLLNDDALLTLDNEIKALICMKLSVKEHEAAEALIAIVKKDRKILTMDISDIETDIVAQKEQDTEDQILADSAVAPTDEVEETEEDSEQEQVEEELQPPAGLTTFQALLWKKKHKQSKMHAMQNDLPSTVTYVPSETKEELGKDRT